MKELTTVLTLQFTFIGEFEDKEAERILATAKQRNESWTNILKERIEGPDDLKILGSKVFVRDKED